MDRVSFAEHFIKQYPGKQQVDLSVEIDVPGTWFNKMSPAEKRKQFKCVAVEFDALKPFAGGNPARNHHPAIRFQVLSDVEEDPNHEGYWIKLVTWNRFRHNTFKDDRASEARYILSAASTTQDSGSE
ncbi:hypothetical protein CYMTET_42759 [Cymbomonas tetramitiformis]|uniref:Uncharacterized protein n=1 Tax=Cymbomonas tetramitiformis TaxID=36881 RepID=A0AAE0F2B6_9CHLO|nr:hypothetical protein CYMTET_42759 [Cymbomonas tetramitiformis]